MNLAREYFSACYSPPSATWCQIPHLKVKCPTPGGRKGVKCPWYAPRWGGMFRLQIDGNGISFTTASCGFQPKIFAGINTVFSHLPNEFARVKTERATHLVAGK